MIKDMRVLALKAERIAQSGSSASVRERARGRSDAACWWYARHVELLIGRPEIVQGFQQEAAAIATAEETRGCRERAEGRRGVDAWVLQGFARRWRDADILSRTNTHSHHVG